MTHQAYNPYLSDTPISNISAYGVAGVSNMGLSLSPLLIPAEPWAMEYNKQTGFFFESELGTTPKTTVHPNTANVNCVLYKNNPQWGYRSAIQRYEGFFPNYYLKRVSGGCWFLLPGDTTNMPNDPISDFGFKFGECNYWTNSYWDSRNVYVMSYCEPWGLHTKYIDTGTAYANAADIAANQTCAYTHDGCPTATSRGDTVMEYGQAILNSYMQNYDGSIMGPDNPRWAGRGLLPLAAEPGPGQGQHDAPRSRASPGPASPSSVRTTGSGLAPPHRDQPTNGEHFTGLYWDSVSAFGTAFGFEDLSNCRGGRLGYL